MKELIELILGCPPLPEPEVDWAAFLAHLGTVLEHTPNTRNPFTGKLEPWINLQRLAQQYGKRTPVRKKCATM
jgi:hypothetical protein